MRLMVTRINAIMAAFFLNVSIPLAEKYATGRARGNRYRSSLDGVVKYWYRERAMTTISSRFAFSLQRNFVTGLKSHFLNACRSPRRKTGSRKDKAVSMCNMLEGWVK